MHEPSGTAVDDVGVTVSGVYVLRGRILAMIGLCFRMPRAKDVELLVLRAENQGSASPSSASCLPAGGSDLAGGAEPPFVPPLVDGGVHGDAGDVVELASQAGRAQVGLLDSARSGPAVT